MEQYKLKYLSSIHNAVHHLSVWYPEVKFEEAKDPELEDDQIRLNETEFIQITYVREDGTRIEGCIVTELPNGHIYSEPDQSLVACVRSVSMRQLQINHLIEEK